MRLFEVIDPDRTAQNVADFLRGKGHYRYRGYPKLLEDEAVFGMVSSPVGDITGIHGSSGNRVEEAMIAKAHCRSAISCVTDAINSCLPAQQIILNERYIKGVKREVVMQMVLIGGNDQYQDADIVARTRFAAALDKLVEIRGCEDLIPPVQVWK
ncbi:hypothetical protein [Limosilactobacillus fermentum]|uniref:hypothetical protein n=1 Tax=Limosilactobacillus fermentum TaxID=1613 RepID=UPI003D77C3C1